MRKACSRCSLMSEGVTTFRSRRGWTVNLCDDCLEELEMLGIDLFGERGEHVDLCDRCLEAEAREGKPLGGEGL